MACRTRDPQLFSTGTNLVVALDDRLILKIFPPLLRHQFVSERAALSQLRGRLSVPIPEIVLEGERDQWPYLVITRLQGVVGSQAWPILPEDQKERVLGQIGETIAEVQRVPVGEIVGRRAALGGVHLRANRGMPRPARASRAAAKISRRARRPASRRGGAHSSRRAAGDPDRRVHSGEFSAEPRKRELAVGRPDRLRRRVHRMGRIRPARAERLHDGRNAAPGRKAFSTASDIRQRTSRPR